jgi:hypothetical protein
MYALPYRADSVKFVVNSAPGRINSAEICQFSGMRCGGFEAGSSRGYLIVNLTNTGYLNASYTLTVSSSQQEGGIWRRGYLHLQSLLESPSAFTSS